MKIVVAMDSFKGSLSSQEAEDCVEENIKAVKPEIEVVKKVMADGGEGTLDALYAAKGGEYKSMMVHDAYGKEISARYLLQENGTLAVIEVAEIIGLPSCPQQQPRFASSYGVGEVIAACLDQGITRFIIGLGGSATNDGGLGMLQALGAKVRFQEDRFDLWQFEAIDLYDLDSRLKDCAVLLACDVDNPLCGKLGASAVYGPQKGVLPHEVARFDQVLSFLADELTGVCHKDLRNEPGAGAAGGLGFALMMCTRWTKCSGAKVVMAAHSLEEAMQNADLVITGEGCMDEQSAMGKMSMQIAKLASSYNLPVIALAGSVKPSGTKLHEWGMTAVFSIQTTPCTLEEAMDPLETRRRLGLTVQEVMRLVLRLF